jgi:hypothetical protein
MTDGAAQADTARFYVRVVETPPGAPWDQSRAARLDALLGSPLAGDALSWAVERLAPWRPRTPGRFGVAYARRDDAPAGLTTLAVENAQVRFRFSTPEDRNRRLRAMAMTGLLATAAISGLGLGSQKALSVRAEREAALARLEVNARGWDRVARFQNQAASDTAALRRAGVEGAAFGDLAADLFWLGRAKAPSVTIERVRWNRSGMEVTAIGPGQPVIGSERTVEALGGSDSVRAWRIGPAHAAPVERRSGISRPSVAMSIQERAQAAGGER